MVASLSPEGELSVALVSRPDHDARGDKTAHINVCRWQRRGNPPLDEWTKAAHYAAENKEAVREFLVDSSRRQLDRTNIPQLCSTSARPMPPQVDALSRLTPYKIEEILLWHILERLRVVRITFLTVSSAAARPRQLAARRSRQPAPAGPASSGQT